MTKMNRFASGLPMIAELLIAASAHQALAGPDWQEQGDAGSLIADGQQVVGAGQLNSISGSFSDGLGLPDYEDVYLVTISSPATFSINVTSSIGTVGIFIFDAATGQGILGSLTGNIGNTATDFSGAAITSPGTYAIALAVNGRLPGNDSGQMFTFASAGETSGPDGNGGFSALAGWDGSPGPVGEYSLELIGSTFTRVPAPGAIAVIGFATIAAGRRRR